MKWIITGVITIVIIALIIAVKRIKEGKGGLFLILLGAWVIYGSIKCIPILAKPTVTSCTLLPDGRYQLQDSTRYCNPEIGKPGSFITNSDTCCPTFSRKTICGICGKPYWAHDKKQRKVTDQIFIWPERD